MKRVVSLAVGLLLALPATAADGAAPDVVKDEFIYADWMVPTTRTGVFDWYAAVGFRFAGTTAQGGIEVAGFLKGTCRTSRKATSCSAFGRSGKLKTFDVQPGGGSATLEVRYGRELRTARWTALPPPDHAPGVFLSELACDNGVPYLPDGMGAGVVRDSAAEARMFGRRFTAPGRRSGAEIWWGAMVADCDFQVRAADGTFDSPGEDFTVTKATRPRR